jgi:hypothetical protein
MLTMARWCFCLLVAKAAGMAAVQAPRMRLPDDARQTRSVAILISGMLDRLVVTPLIENLVRANVEAGTPVDTYFAMKPPSEVKNYAANKGESKWLVTESSAEKYTVDPKIARIRYGPSDQLFEHLCRWSRQAGAGTCTSEPETDDPLELPNDEAHQPMLSFYSPLSTASGANVLKRWRTIENLWGRAKQTEQAGGFRYNSVLIVRDDDYWLTPYIFDTTDFAAHPNSLKSISCLEAHGINDKMIHLGRKAMETVGMAYQAWKDMAPPQTLQDTRNAEEFLFKLAMVHGVGMRPLGFKYALATTTVSGIPCFRKQKYNLTGRGGYNACHDEACENSPITKLFRSFSCDTMNPTYFDALGKQFVTALTGAVLEAAGAEEAPIVFIVAGNASIDSAARTLLSLSKASSSTKAVVVTQELQCKAIQRQSDNAVCIETPQNFKEEDEEAASYRARRKRAGDFNDLKFKLALFTTALFSSAARGILFAEPGVEFQSDPIKAFTEASKGRDIVLAPKQSQQCSEVAAGGDVTDSLFYVRNTPGGSHALMRAWMFLAEGVLTGGLYPGEAVVSDINFDHLGRELKVGDTGFVRGGSHKDPGRLVIDFEAWADLTGLALRPDQVSPRVSWALLARAVATSFGVRGAATLCSRPGWEHLPKAA